MTLDEAVQMAAGSLPDGWELRVCAERGAGWIELYDFDGDRFELAELADSSLAEKVDAAVSEALRACGLAMPVKETKVSPCQHDLMKADHTIEVTAYGTAARCKVCESLWTIPNRGIAYSPKTAATHLK